MKLLTFSAIIVFLTGCLTDVDVNQPATVERLLLVPQFASSDFYFHPAHENTFTYLLRNETKTDLDSITIFLSPSETFELINDQCHGQVLKEKESCEVSIRLHAQDNQDLSGILGVNTDSRSLFIELNTFATGFFDDLKILPDSIDLNLNALVHTSFNTPIQTVTLKNTGNRPSTALQISDFNFPDQIKMAPSDQCSGKILMPEESCSLGIYFTTNDNLSYLDQLRVKVRDQFFSAQIMANASGFFYEINSQLIAGPGLNQMDLIATTPYAPPYLSLPLVFRLENDGNKISPVLGQAVLAGDTDHFQIVDHCQGIRLAPAESCEIEVFATASDNTTYNALLEMLNGDSYNLSGEASGFTPILEFTPLVINDLDVTGGDPTQGTTRTLTLTNTGNIASDIISIDLQNLHNIQILNDHCDGEELAPLETCTIEIRSIGYMNEIFSTQLSADDGDVDTSITLGGEVSGFPVPFIARWQTDNMAKAAHANHPNPAHTSTDYQIALPLWSGQIYDFYIDWGDGNRSFIDRYDHPEAIHTYDSIGTYDITITGDFSTLRFQNHGDVEKFIDILQWGDNTWHGMEESFFGAVNLDISASDGPVLFRPTPPFVVNMASAFRDATSLTADLSHWDTSNVANMSFLFRNAQNFNGDISSWDVSNVTNFNSMFVSAISFNQDISNWDELIHK